MGGHKRRVITPELRREVIRRAAKGESYRQILASIDVSLASVCRILKPFGGVIRFEDWQVSSARLSLEERVEIKLGLQRGDSLRVIASAIGRNASTVCREINNNGGRENYRPVPAHRKACALARRPKPTKLGSNRLLRARVIADLEKLWSPQQIVRRLRAEFGDDEAMSISHETIYKSLYVQGRGELRRELTRCLRTGRASRQSRKRLDRRGRIPAMVMISDRPAEVEDRAVPGHWEGDLIFGNDNKIPIGTLVERATRFLMLLHLPDGHSAEAVRDAMAKTIATLPESLRRSITWDQGKELTQHVQFTVDTGVQIYFCDPHSPWQRGSNENTNGLLRQYFPKKSDFRRYTAQDLQAAADSLNGRPRQTLGWMTPAERLAEFVATTA